MKLLKGAASGGLGLKAAFSAGVSVAKSNWPTIGATLIGATSVSGYPAIGSVTGTFYYTGTTLTDTGMAQVRGWPWTTGMVTVSAFLDHYTYGLFPEHLARTGYDNRTSQGGGTIQLVTPHLTNWVGGISQYGVIGVLRLKFVPEPPSGLILLAGVGLLGVLYRRRARNGPGLH
jgi:hypothetical protein